MIKRVLESLHILQLIRWVLFNTTRRRTSVEINGIKKSFMSTSPDLHRRVISVGGEREQLSRFLESVEPGDVVWDIGAFMGMFSIFSSECVGERGKVVAFEPEESAFSMVSENVRLNRAANIEVLNLAISDENSKSGMVYPSLADGNAIHSLRPNAGLEEQGQEIEIRRGDDLVAEGRIPAPTVIKMDIEGAEYRALSGMSRLLSDPRCRYIFLEVHPADLPGFGSTMADVERLIEGAGFDITDRIERGTEFHFFCQKSGRTG